MEQSEKKDFSKVEISLDEAGNFGINMKDWAIISVISLVLGLLLSWGGMAAAAAHAKPIAATVNGDPIYENEITQMILEVRLTQDAQDDETWASWLSNNGYTSESLRQTAIESRVSGILLEQATKEYGVNISNEDVENAYADEAANYGGEETFSGMLASAGMTPADYKERIRLILVRNAISDVVIPEQTISDEQVIEAISNAYPDMFDPQTQKLEDLDPSLVAYVRGVLEENASQMAWSVWFGKYREQADVVVNDMPQGLSYDVAPAGE